MSFSFSAQGVNKKRISIETEEKNDLKTKYFNKFNRDITPIQLALISLEKELKKHKNISDVLRKNIKNDALKLYNLKFLNMKYLALSFSLLMVNKNHVDSNLIDLDNKVNKDIYNVILNEIGTKVFEENLHKIKEQVFIYCTLIVNSKSIEYNPNLHQETYVGDFDEDDEEENKDKYFTEENEEKSNEYYEESNEYESDYEVGYR